MLSSDDEELLEKKRPDLVKRIDIQGSTVLAELRARQALTRQQEEVIKSKAGNTNQAGELLDTLLRGDATTMDKFIYALRCSGHKALVDTYLREPLNEDPRNPGPTAQLQETLRHSIDEYLHNDPSRILSKAECANYISQLIVAHKTETEGEAEKIPAENVSQLLQNHISVGQRVFVYGAGGTGKSSLCRHIAQTWAGGESELCERFAYVFPIPMRAARSHSIVDIICKDTQLIPETHKQRVEQELKFKTVLFIFDSFEELSHNTPELNQLIRRELYPKSTVLITARPGHKLEEEETGSTPYIKVDLQELTDEQVRSYMSGYPGLQEDVQLRMKEKFGMDFLRKPINVWLLSLLVAQLAFNADMPNTQTDLLNMIIQCLMLAYSKKKNLSDLNLTPESPYKKQKLSELNLTSESPMKNAPAEVKRLLKEVGELCFFGLKDKERVLVFDDGVLSKEDVIAMGLFSEGADDNSVTLPHPLFQEYLAALFLSVDKRARQDLLKEIREESEGSSPRSSLVDVLRPRGFDNMVRFLVGLSPGVAAELSQLFVIRQLKYSGDCCHDLGYELDLLRECSVEEERSVIAAALLKAPVLVTDKKYQTHNTDSHILLHHFNEEERLVFLKKFYGCQICSHELIQAPDSRDFWLDSFVVGMIYLHNCTVRLKIAKFRHCQMPVSMLTDRLVAVKFLTLRDSTLCDLSESQFLASLNLTPLSHSSPAMSLRQREALLSTVWISRVKGLNLLCPPHCTLPTTQWLIVSDCGDVNLGSLCQCFTGVSVLMLRNNKHVHTGNAGQWSSVRKLDLLSPGDRVDLISLKEMFVQLEELEVSFTALRVERTDPDRHTQWHTVKDLELSTLHLYTDERTLTEEEAREFLTHLCPEAEINIEDYGDISRHFQMLYHITQDIVREIETQIETRSQWTS